MVAEENSRTRISVGSPVKTFNKPPHQPAEALARLKELGGYLKARITDQRLPSLFPPEQVATQVIEDVRSGRHALAAWSREGRAPSVARRVFGVAACAALTTMSACASILSGRKEYADGRRLDVAGHWRC